MVPPAFPVPPRRQAPFWASWALFQGLLAVVEACLLVGFGCAFGFKLVRPWRQPAVHSTQHTAHSFAH